MVTIFEEAMDLLDAAHGIVEMTFDTFETEPVLSSALYGIKHLLDESIHLLCIVESEDKEEAHTALDDTAQASAKTNQSQNITYHEMMSKQFDESEGLHEIPATEGTLDALDAVIESAPKPRGTKAKGFRLWKDGATSYAIAQECNISEDVARKWIKEFGRAQK